ncbi:hypothetical protein B0H16DRAFT_225562 [Mycena metata]|uniref:F-box domain-containing protein n=1 Tax=Mycena metata TaxID=1033252 RepID=A0AAD7HYA2_9AGAR|nr:hypothetical protein B0H16DRAFT_225562 [Mycena metata]
MHRCLSVQELLALIFSHLDPREDSGHRSYSWRQPALQDLAVVARTCGTFREPALDRLWRSSALVNLLRCMPADLWAIDTEVPDGWKCSMRARRAIRPEDWNRVLACSPRIRDLGCNSWDCDLSGIFPVISVCLPDQLLPNLQTLYWCPADPIFHYIHLFLGPKITSLTFSGSSIPAISLLPTLALKCPTLKDVSISSGEKKAVSIFLRSLECLESVHVETLDHSTLEHLSRLPTLTSLRLNTLPVFHSLSPRFDPQPFAVLRKLHLDSMDMEAITHFLRSCKEVPLRSLSFYVQSYPTTAESHEFYRALSASVLHSSLTEASFDVGINTFDGNTPNFRIHRESIQFLAAFTNLVTIDISSPVGIDWDDTTAAELARAWPHLETLHMTSYGPSRSPPDTTLECLYSFAKWCPRLADLTITFDGIRAPPSLDQTPGRPSQYALKSIDVAHSRISTAITPVVQFLSTIFPDLKRIATSRDGLNNEDLEELRLNEEAIGFHHLWKEVELLLVIQDAPAHH